MRNGPRPGHTTGVIKAGPLGLHWCQPLPFSVPGAREARCGYCAALLERDVDGAWRWANLQPTLGLT